MTESYDGLAYHSTSDTIVASSSGMLGDSYIRKLTTYNGTDLSIYNSVTFNAMQPLVLGDAIFVPGPNTLIMTAITSSAALIDVGEPGSVAVYRQQTALFRQQATPLLCLWQPLHDQVQSYEMEIVEACSVTGCQPVNLFDTAWSNGGDSSCNAASTLSDRTHMIVDRMSYEQHTESLVVSAREIDTYTP
jgi:hypothetical protein